MLPTFHNSVTLWIKWKKSDSQNNVKYVSNSQYYFYSISTVPYNLSLSTLRQISKTEIYSLVALNRLKCKHLIDLSIYS